MKRKCCSHECLNAPKRSLTLDCENVVVDPYATVAAHPTLGPKRSWNRHVGWQLHFTDPSAPLRVTTVEDLHCVLSHLSVETCSVDPHDGTVWSVTNHHASGRLHLWPSKHGRPEGNMSLASLSGPRYEILELRKLILSSAWFKDPLAEDPFQSPNILPHISCKSSSNIEHAALRLGCHLGAEGRIQLREFIERSGAVRNGYAHTLLGKAAGGMHEVLPAAPNTRKTVVVEDKPFTICLKNCRQLQHVTFHCPAYASCRRNIARLIHRQPNDIFLLCRDVWKLPEIRQIACFFHEILKVRGGRRPGSRKDRFSMDEPMIAPKVIAFSPLSPPGVVIMSSPLTPPPSQNAHYWNARGAAT